MNNISNSRYIIINDAGAYYHIVYIIIICVNEIIFTLQQLNNYTETKPGTTALYIKN